MLDHVPPPPAPEELDARLDELMLSAAIDDVPALLNDLGAIAALRGDLGAAVTHLRCAHLLDPSRAEIVRNLDEVRALTDRGRRPERQHLAWDAAPDPQPAR